MPESKPYDWTQFKMKIEIKATPQKVYKAWTDGREMAKWFPEKAEIVPKKGGRIYLEWLGGVKMDDKVTAARKNSLFQFPFGLKGEQVKITVKKVKGGSVCELHQFNMKTGPKDKVGMHMGCMSGWVFFMNNLKAFLEHGIDLRSHDLKKSYKQGYCNS
jgi:uncharacterized protein YndB with AHSA1/START domain